MSRGDYLSHILQAIQRIQRYTDGLTERAFRESDIVQDAVVRNLELIGEACRNIERDSRGFAAAHPEFPLAAAYEMRNARSHGYFRVDLGIVWKTIQGDLPALREQVLRITSETPP
jgi:uncharacterized protein with HEPN domain